MGVQALHTLTMADIRRVGGKAASLGELLQTKQRVPRGFVVTADEQTVSPVLQNQILRMFDDLGLQRVAVRSSGVEEDGTDKSWAGQFATLLNVDRTGLIDAIKACRASGQTARAKAYGKAARLAVLIQHMVQSDVAGVAFSAHPVTGNPDHIVIEAVYGLCEPLVSGTATPDHFVLHKHSAIVLGTDIAKKPTMLRWKNGQNQLLAVDTARQHQPAIDDQQLAQIAGLARMVENHYGFPVDIEWTYENNVLYLLQARPITTL